MIATYEQAIQTHHAASLRDARLKDLELRLERGLVMIEESRKSGEPVDHLEDHWIALLNEYQAVYDGAH